MFIMNNHEITRFMKSHPRTKGIFVSTHAADTLPNKPRTKLPSAYVINTHKSHQPGEHWVCIYFPISGLPEYFDSFGFLPKKDFKNFLGEDYIYNKRFIQYPFSSVCGQYCMYFILRRSMNRTMSGIISQFTEDNLENDIMVNSVIESSFNVDLDVFDAEFVGKQIARSFIKTK